MDYNNQGTATIVSSSLIQPYKIFFYSNSKIWPHHKTLCMGVSVAYMPKSYIHQYYHDVCFFWKIKDHSCNAQNRRSGENPNHLFETYKNSVIPHGKNVFQTAPGMVMIKLCVYPSSNYALPNHKCVLRCCAQYQRIDLPSP